MNASSARTGRIRTAESLLIKLRATVAGETVRINGSVVAENGFVRTGGIDVEMTVHESTSREIQMDGYSG